MLHSTAVLLRMLTLGKQDYESLNGLIKQCHMLVTKLCRAVLGALAVICFQSLFA